MDVVKSDSNKAYPEMDANHTIDQLEALMLNGNEFPLVDCPLIHRFTPGIYIREIFMPAGSLITSKIHKTEHPYVVSKGALTVFTENEGRIYITAPHTGITKPGTRRVLLIHEDTIWITFHAVSEGESVEDIENRILEPYVNQLLDVNKLNQ